MTDFASDLKQRFVWAMDTCLESYEVLADGRSFVRSDQDERAIPLFASLRDSVVAMPPALIEAAEALRANAPDVFEKSLSDALRVIGTELGRARAAEFVENLNRTVQRELSGQDGGDLSELRRLATEFRQAIERCPRNRMPVTFTDFPRGACGDAVLLLAKYLERNGHTGFAYVLGMRDGGSHAWLGRGALIVDITADQFEDQARPVIVDTLSSWHASFRIDPEDQQQPADFERYDQATAATLANAYVAIIGQMPHSAAAV